MRALYLYVSPEGGRWYLCDYHGARAIAHDWTRGAKVENDLECEACGCVEHAPGTFN